MPLSRAGLSFLSERPYFYDHLTVRETLRFAHRLSGRKQANVESDMKAALETVELSASFSARVRDLSKGMQQRLSMAQALICGPELLVLDEPMSGLDPLCRRLFRTILHTLGTEGKSVFFSSHILDDVEELCSHVVVLSKGSVAYQGAIDGLLSQGYGDTECVVKGLTPEDRLGLDKMGFKITENPVGTFTIVVPIGRNAGECQGYLCEKGLFCESVAKRSASLEDILYKKKQGAIS